eukprot:920347-Amphidinium_carterae.1
MPRYRKKPQSLGTPQTGGWGVQKGLMGVLGAVGGNFRIPLQALLGVSQARAVTLVLWAPLVRLLGILLVQSVQEGNMHQGRDVLLVRSDATS